MSHSIEASTFRIINPSGSVLGTGFLVSDDLVVTCSHVLPPDAESIQVQLAGREEMYAAIVQSDYHRDEENGDVALLRLERLPDEAVVLPLGTSTNSQSGNPFQTFGFPKLANINGVHARREVLGNVSENDQKLIQLRSMEIKEGHSGAPVWDEKRGVVIGMVVSVNISSTDGKLRDTAFAIPTVGSLIPYHATCPELSDQN